jgi:hypothetical protein
MNNYIILVCKNVQFYTSIDAHTFFDWLQGISVVKKVQVINNQIYIWIAQSNLTYEDLNRLVGLFVRYNIETLPLKLFMNDENRDWFHYWVTKSSERK